MNEAIERIRAKAAAKGVRLSPAAARSEVEDFERRRGIALPPDYWSSVLRVGYGGDGEYPRKPFHFDRPWIWEEGEITPAIEKRLDTLVFGNLILGHDGCGRPWSLAITGPQRGRVWMPADVGAQPCAPSLSFLQRYERWLAENCDWWREYRPS